jgi:hypothetical protein
MNDPEPEMSREELKAALAGLDPAEVAAAVDRVPLDFEAAAYEAEVKRGKDAQEAEADGDDAGTKP